PAVAEVLVFIDRNLHFPQCGPQLNFPFPANRVPGERHGHADEYRDNQHGDQQFDQRESVITETQTSHGAVTVTSAGLPAETFCWASRILNSVIRNAELPARDPRSRT